MHRQLRIPGVAASQKRALTEAEEPLRNDGAPDVERHEMRASPSRKVTPFAMREDVREAVPG